jgi:hypothetical protein
VGAALLALDGEVLHAGDWRTTVSEAAPPAHLLQDGWSVDRGLLTAMAELLEAQTRIATILAEERARASARTPPPAVLDMLRLHQVVEPILSGLLVRAKNHAPDLTPAWQRRLDAARGQQTGAQAEVRILADRMLRGKNPLGIEDEDLPLYFRQIRTDAGSRFTAISDYLLGDNFSTNAPATRLVGEALDAFEVARTAYLAESARAINGVNAETEQVVRVADAECELGYTLQDLCGIDAFSETDPCALASVVDQDYPEGFNVHDCFFRSEAQECQPPDLAPIEAFRAADELTRDAAFSMCVALGAKKVRTSSFSFAAVDPSFVPLNADLRNTIRLFKTWGMEEHYALPIVDKLWDEVRQSFVGLPSVNHGQSLRSALDVDGTIPFEDGFPARLEEDTPYGWDDALNVVDLNTGLVVGAWRPRVGYQTSADPDLLRVATTNPCRNPLAAGVPGFFPEVIVSDEAGSPRLTLRCAPADGITGPTIEKTVTAADLIVDPSFNSVAVPDMERVIDRCSLAFREPNRSKALAQSSAPSSCYRGSLGSATYALRQLVLATEEARADTEALVREYDISMQSCALLQKGNLQLTDAMVSHSATMTQMQTHRDILESASSAANGAADCLDTIAGNIGTDLSTGVKVGMSVGSCAARGVSVGLEIAATVVQASMDRTERAHEIAMSNIESATDEARCFKEAELALVGMESSNLAMQQALLQLSQGYLEHTHSLEQAQLAYTNGIADIAWANEIAIRVVGPDPWMKSDVETYARKMKLARRAAYLAVRAVEYEFQQSLSARGTVLRAEHPGDLDAALDAVLQVKASGSVNGAQPAELTEVVSLRDHLLQVGDIGLVDPAEQPRDSVERFRRYLTDPRFQVTRDGQLVGIEIPFRVAPFSVFDRGNPVGLPIVSDSSCAQRGWSVNASIVGDEARVFRGVVPQVNVEIRQRNTFFATRCADDAGDPFQVASTRPSRNLFAEPGVGVGVGDLGLPEEESFAKARVQARLNVDPLTFIDPDFSAGASTELAARLLFGDYALFIPATSLAQVNGAGEATGDGLRLNEVDDVLLRFDYLSVAR